MHRQQHEGLSVFKHNRFVLIDLLTFEVTRMYIQALHSGTTIPIQQPMQHMQHMQHMQGVQPLQIRPATSGTVPMQTPGSFGVVQAHAREEYGDFQGTQARQEKHTDKWGAVRLKNLAVII
jgi:hypothetical protein